MQASSDVLWQQAREGSFIVKTVGIQALFDILKKIVPRAIDAKDVSVKFFSGLLQPAAAIDFAADNFRNASRSGRMEIRRAIEQAMGLAASS